MSHSDTPVETLSLAEQIASLIEETAGIETQLADKNRCHPQTGKRLSFAEYNAWRQRALTALNYKRAELRRLRQQLRDQAVQVKAVPAAEAELDLEGALLDCREQPAEAEPVLRALYLSYTRQLAGRTLPTLDHEALQRAGTYLQQRCAI